MSMLNVYMSFLTDISLAFSAFSALDSVLSKDMSTS